MAYLLQLNGTSGYGSFVTPLTMPTNADLDFDIEWGSLSGTYEMIVGTWNVSGNEWYFGKADVSTGIMTLYNRATGSRNNSATGVLINGERATFRLERRGNVMRVLKNGVQVIAPMTFGAGVIDAKNIQRLFSSNTTSQYFSNAKVYGVTLTNADTSAAVFYLNPSLSGGTGSVIPDAVGSNNLNLSGGYTWVFYSSGADNESTISFDIGSIDYAISSTIAAPSTTATIAYDIGAITFAASSTVSAPATTATINYDIGAISFATSASVGASSAVAFDIGSVDYSISASATSNASAAISFDIGEINFDLSALVVSNISTTISYDIGSIDFAVYCTIPTNEPERSLMTKDNVFWRNSIFFKSGRT